MSDFSPLKRDPLLKTMQNDPEYFSFGAEIAERSERSILRGERDLPFAAKASIADLRLKTHALLQSSNQTDREAVEHTRYLFNTNDMALFKNDAIGLSRDPGNDILEWITNSRGQDGFRDVAIFALWNRMRREQLQKRLLEDRDLMKTKMLESTEQLEGAILPRGATELYEKTYDASVIKAMDSFEAGLMVAGGYHDKGIIAFPNFYYASDHMYGHTTRSEGVVIHEGTHAVGWRNGSGFMRGIASPIARRVWEEFFASHIEAVATSKPGWEEPYNINPALRHDAWRPYHVEAKYISSIDTLTDNGTPIDLIGEAYISEFDEHEPSRERLQLEEKIIKVSGSIAAWNTFTEIYEKANMQYERDHILEREIRRLEDTFGIFASSKRPMRIMVQSSSQPMMTEYELANDGSLNIITQFIQG